MSEEKLNLLEQLIRINWLLHRGHLRSHRNHGPIGNPYNGQGRVLRLLKMTPEISQKDLLYLLDMRPQSLGQLLAKLEGKGYITRSPSEEDRRVMDIRLTDQGMEVANQVEQPEDPEMLFNFLSQEEQAGLGEYLDRIISNLENQMGEEQEDCAGRCPKGYGHGFAHHHHNRYSYVDSPFPRQR